jgi:hypothetical protein
MSQSQNGNSRDFPCLSFLLSDASWDRVLEHFFRMYLSYLVKKCRFPLEVVYTPAKSLHLRPISISSPVKDHTLAPSPVLMIQPLTPRFYTNIAKYSDAKSGFSAEIESMPQVSDPISQRLWVSDPVLLQNLIDSENPGTGLKETNPCSPAASRLSWQSMSSGESFMDNFTDSHCSKTMRTTYRAAHIHCYLTERLAWGSYRLAAIYGILLRTIFMRLVWKRLWQMQCNLAMVWFADVLMVSGTLFLLVRTWRGLTGRFYQ